jgi:tetratricopeptide (TPR) repeat protein
MVDDYKWTVYTTWEMSMEKLSPTAATFLHLCAFLHYDGISKAIFQNAAAGKPRSSFKDAIGFLQHFQTTDGAWSDFQLHELINELASFSLININAENNIYCIHPLIHAWAQDCTSMAEQDNTRACIMEMLALSIVYQYSTEDYAFRKTLLPHINKVYTKNMESHLAEQFQLVYAEGGQWKQAEELQVQVMDMMKRTLGKEHPDTLISMGDLASTYWKQGMWKEADELQVQVMETTRMALGKQHTNTLTIMGNLALTYSNQGRWKEAEELQVQVMETMIKALGKEHPDTLISMNNLVLTYNNQGRWKEAEELQVQVMETMIKALGKQHPDTLTSMNNLAWTYSNQGRWKEAEELQMQVVEISKRVLGKEHFNMVARINNLASMYKAQGEWKEAEELQL